MISSTTYTSPAAADTTLNWLTINSLHTGNLPSPDQSDPNINLDCQNESIPISAGKTLRQSCMISTNFGRASTAGYVIRNGTTLAGKLKYPNGFDANILPISNSEDIFRVARQWNGNNLYLLKSAATKMTPKHESDGTLTYTLDPAGSFKIGDRSGNLFSFIPDTITYSLDGEWLVGDVPYIGAVRVNTKTAETLPFGPPNTYGLGFDPALITAISSDGRYAALASNQLGMFRLYDLSTCNSVPNYVTGPVKCSYKDIYPFVKKLNNYTAVVRIRFDYLGRLRMVYAHSENNIRTVYQILLSPSEIPAAIFDYIALGDSFASGEGAFSYKYGTDKDINKCHLSLVSYPYLISSRLDLYKHESVACSGAKMKDIESEGDYIGQLGDGIKQSDRNLDEYLGSFTPAP